MEKICILGSNSFSGATLIDSALTQGAEVFGLSRSDEYHPVFLPYKKNPAAKKRFHFVKADLNTDLDTILRVVRDFKPDYFINFASQSMVAESWQNPDHWYTTNVVGNVRLHEALRKTGALKRYVHISTPEVYGSCAGNVTEDFRFNPSTPYAASRAACDLHLMTFFRNYQFPVVFTRAANVFGPGQQLYRIIPRTILFAKLGKKLQLHGGGHSVRSFIHGRDVAEGTLLAARRGEPPAAFHFSTTRQISIRDLVSLILERMEICFEDAVEIVNERPGKDAAYLLDSGRANRELGWQSRITLDDGIAETIHWIDENLDVLKNQPHDYVHKP